MFKGCAASMAGCGCATVAAIVLIAALSAVFNSGEGSKRAEKGDSDSGSPRVLVVDLSTPIVEKPSGGIENIFAGGAQIGFYDFISAIKRAKTDKKISAILITGEFSGGAGAEQIWEISKALKDFKTAKPVVAYLENPELGEYYLASCATKIYIAPMGEFEFKGISIKNVFIGNALKKYGVDAQVIKAGKYKSFGEIFVSDKMSEESRQNISQIADSLWKNIVLEISQNRNLPAEKLRKIASETPVMSAEKAKELGFFDGVLPRDVLIENLCPDGNFDEELGSFPQKSMYDYAVREPKSKIFGGFEYPNAVAIVYLDGTIVDEGERGRDISRRDYCPLLRELRDDDSVKAVILRINSGGGSAFASEQIRREVELLAAEKPVIASFADTAASGAYWIASSCPRIFAGENCITGSIGVFGVSFSAGKLANDFGITFDGVKTEKFADMGGLSRPLNAEELAIVQESVDFAYKRFLGLVSSGRKIPLPEVETLAEGKVYAASDALRLRLIDSVSTLDEIVEKAKRDVKKESGAKRVEVRQYPRPATLSDLFMSFEKFEEPFVKAARGKFLPAAVNEIPQKEKAVKRLKNSAKSQTMAEMPFILEVLN